MTTPLARLRPYSQLFLLNIDTSGSGVPRAIVLPARDSDNGVLPGLGPPRASLVMRMFLKSYLPSPGPDVAPSIRLLVNPGIPGSDPSPAVESPSRDCGRGRKLGKDIFLTPGLSCAIPRDRGELRPDIPLVFGSLNRDGSLAEGE